MSVVFIAILIIIIIVFRFWIILLLKLKYKANTIAVCSQRLDSWERGDMETHQYSFLSVSTWSPAMISLHIYEKEGTQQPSHWKFQGSQAPRKN